MVAHKAAGLADFQFQSPKAQVFNMALDDFFRFTGKGINGKSRGKAVRGGLGCLPAVIILKAIQASESKTYPMLFR
ncbi:hypothetical protein ME793_15640 [Lactobacillus delbrueckii]|nr:hypothetical protein ME793_15640 [Lactobacillus delbrueckii]GHN40086.1 hypothetical protein ME795_13680 [Lactobacillus delbrueckii]GHN44471.1 hypothetical protein ME798_00010 [Lactobacillus delbrueckii]GHN57429.1 hypothetical protein ME804_14690 [Lactobacillus delbrueckii]